MRKQQQKKPLSLAILILGLLVIFALTVGASSAFAQERVTIDVRPTYVVVTEGENENEGFSSTFIHKTTPVTLVGVVQITGGFALRGHIAVPSNKLGLPNDDHFKFQTIRAPQETVLEYRDWSVGAQIRPIETARFVYATFDVGSTNHKRQVEGFESHVPGRGDVSYLSFANMTNRVVSLGIGVGHDFRRFGFNAEAGWQPFGTHEHRSHYSNTTGALHDGKFKVSGSGHSLNATVKHFVNDWAGVSAHAGYREFGYEIDWTREFKRKPVIKRATYGVSLNLRF